jgi:lathosterol oxidase
VIYHWLYDSFGVPGLIVATFAFSAALYFVLAGATYAAVFVWQRRRLVPDYRPADRDLRREIGATMINLLGNCVLFLPIQLAIVFGYTQIYFTVEEYGWAYLAFSAVAALAFAETGIYWLHRALHTPYLFRHLHAHHHGYRTTTPFTSLAFHPVDGFVQSLPYHVFAFVVPINIWLYLVLVFATVIWSVKIHDRVRVLPFDFVNHTGCHTLHHLRCAYNLGQYFTFWDRWCGTYRDPAVELPDEYRASKVPLIGRARG